MAETPSTQESEKPRQPITLAMRIRAVAILGALAATPVIGGFVSYEIGQSVSNSGRGGDIAAANQDKNCIKLESQYAKPGNPVVLRLGALTARQQTDCGVNWVNSTDTTYQYDNVSTPQGTIVQSSIEVRLPSASSLEGNIRHEYAQAADPYSTFDKIGDSALGALLGGVAGLFGMVGIAQLTEKLRNPSSPPPTSAEITA